MNRKGQSHGPWIRLYVKLLDSEKIDRLSDKTFRIWVKLMLVAKENNGILPSLQSVSWRTRDKLRVTSDAYHELVVAGLIEQDPTGDAMHDWEDYQPHSDISTERVRKHRNGKRVSAGTADETERDETDETVSVTDISEEKRREENPPIVPHSGDAAGFALTHKPTDTPPVDPPPKRRREPAEMPAWKAAKFEEFWEHRWANTPKKPARLAWAKAATSPDEADRIIAACRSQAPRLKREGDERGGRPLHAASWLNQERFNDDPPTPVAVMPSSGEPHYEPAYHREYIEPDWMKDGYDPNAQD